MREELRLCLIRGGRSNVRFPVQCDLRLDAMLLAALGMALLPLLDPSERPPRETLCSSNRDEPVAPYDPPASQSGHACALTSSRMEDEDAKG